MVVDCEPNGSHNSRSAVLISILKTPPMLVEQKACKSRHRHSRGFLGCDCRCLQDDHHYHYHLEPRRAPTKIRIFASRNPSWVFSSWECRLSFWVGFCWQLVRAMGGSCELQQFCDDYFLSVLGEAVVFLAAFGFVVVEYQTDRRPTTEMSSTDSSLLLEGRVDSDRETT